MNYGHMCTNLPFGRNLQKKHPAVSSQIPVSFVIMIDRDQSSEGYSVGGRDWPFSHPLLSTSQTWLL